MFYECFGIGYLYGTLISNDVQCLSTYSRITSYGYEKLIDHHKAYHDDNKKQQQK